ncbi:unnamed protein product [Schistocephalus solidus]|uniref:Uncharacterized protein n=1 Tax=Schistocephalus solidus TaxID=70667 RepID=A0A183TMS3_SCHSO|nr:unnamed protein product [Schistocephalus solidus]
MCSRNEDSLVESPLLVEVEPPPDTAYNTPCINANGAQLILKMRWRDRIAETEVLKRTGILSSHAVAASATAMEQPPGENA